MASPGSRFFDRPDIATRALLGICVADFLLMVLLDRRIPLALLGGNMGLIGGTPTMASFVAVGGIWDMLLEVQPWRYLSAVFVHLGVDHLAFNMMALWSFGRAIEARFGAPQLTIIFVLTGIVGFVASRLYYGPISPPTAGASGALYGLIGVELGALLARKDPEARGLFFERLAFAVGFALLFSVNNAAHAGGCVLGVAFGYLLEKLPRRRPSSSLSRVGAWACLAASVLSIVLSAATILAS